MSLEKTIIIQTTEGHEYWIGFSKFDDLVVPESITKVLVEIVIAIDDNKGLNNAKTLFTFSRHIKDYLIEKDVILYCYCDNKEIERGERNKQLAPQEFRSLLFKKMFDRALSIDADFINKPIILTDKNLDKHYIHLFSRSENIEELEILGLKLDEFNK